MTKHNKANTPEADTENLRREAYRLYQLDWMASHGYSPMDLAASFLAYMDNGEPLAKIGSGDELDPWTMWEQDAGFGGEIWACFEEFLQTEYLDESYMTRLLPLGIYPKWQCDAFDLTHMNKTKED